MSGGGDTTQTNTATLARGFEHPILGPGGVVERGQNLAEQGKLVAGPVRGDLTRQAEEQALQAGAGIGQLLTPLQQSFQSLAGFDTVNDPRTEAIAQAATRPIQEQFDRQIAPTIDDAAIQAGQFGGTRAGVAEGVARADTNQAIADVRSRIFFDALQQDLARQERLPAMAGQLARLGLIPSQITAGVGGARDAFAQATAGNEGANLLQLGRLLQGLSPGSTQTAITEGGGMSGGQGALGGALAGAGLAAQLPDPTGMSLLLGAGLGATGGYLSTR